MTLQTPTNSSHFSALARQNRATHPQRARAPTFTRSSTVSRGEKKRGQEERMNSKKLSVLDLSEAAVTTKEESVRESSASSGLSEGPETPELRRKKSGRPLTYKEMSGKEQESSVLHVRGRTQKSSKVNMPKEGPESPVLLRRNTNSAISFDGGIVPTIRATCASARMRRLREIDSLSSYSNNSDEETWPCERSAISFSIIMDSVLQDGMQDSSATRKGEERDEQRKRGMRERLHTFCGKGNPRRHSRDEPESPSIREGGMKIFLFRIATTVSRMSAMRMIGDLFRSGSSQ